MKIFLKITIGLFLLIFCLSCDDTQKGDEEVPKKNTISLAPVNQLVDFLYPSTNSILSFNDSLVLKYTVTGKSLDSVIIKLDGEVLFKAQGPSKTVKPIYVGFKTVGRKKIEFNFYQGKEIQHVFREINVVSDVEPQQVSYKVIKRYPHDPDAYTQGLEFVGNELYESTGQYGVSDFRKVELETGEVRKKKSISGEYFAEGLTFFENKFYQLTWQEDVCFVYDKNMTLLESRKIPFDTQGWGLTHNDTCLIMSNGSGNIYFLDSETLLPLKTLEIYNNKTKLLALNELEIINGLLYANVYQTNKIMVIDLETGKNLAVLNMKGLLDERFVVEGHTDVLNGIAYNKLNNRMYVTGKNWPFLFQIKVPFFD